MNCQANSEAEAGFVYKVRVRYLDGTCTPYEETHNLMPIESLNHMMGVTYKGVTQAPTWYIGLYEGNYTPVPTITAATIAAAATECTSYTPAQRVEFVEGAVANGAVDNSASPAEFTFTAAKTIYGGFICSASPHGAVTGVLGSAVKFASPKQVGIGDVLEVIAGNSLVSA
ncbi:MAG: hypothetical protein EOP82_21675 [Variovorax sp.]|nr:MAG: hypothetical protein EOP82_21675 [Variovorax sp.]